jgi:hypothetical protein
MEKTFNKSENIRKAAETYKNDSELSLRNAIEFYFYALQLIINYLNNKHRSAPNVYIFSQRLTSVEESVLIIYIM